jgi:hypothetical protein
MAYFAKLDENNNVIGVHTIINDVMTINGVESEQAGIDFLTNLHGHNLWKQTSYNTRGGIHYHFIYNTPSEDQTKAFRKNYAGIGYTYDEQIDAFIPPKPYPSWILNEFSCLWESPVPYPNDGNIYRWNEDTQTWDLINE